MLGNPLSIEELFMDATSEITFTSQVMSTESTEDTFEDYLSNLTFGNFTIEPDVPVLAKYYPILAMELGLSILCSIFLIIIYVIVGEYRTLPGKNVISISSCLIVTYVLLMVDLLLRNSIPYGICGGIGIVVQAAFLATFFWTNVMSFDIMITMSSVKKDNNKASEKYWKYATYAWCMTLVCIILTVAMDHNDFLPLSYKPQFGRKRCWLTGQLAFLIYLNVPVGLTLLANCIFFIVTARTIEEVRSATTILAVNRHRKKFRLCMKLVLIMGLVWITEFIPWITGIFQLYAVAGMLNCLHGVYLFLIFACKRRTFKQVAELVLTCCQKADRTQKQKTPSMDTVITLSH
ncbi:probable G-protein coupled receptor Mth-like 1 [Uloborus diversus]|uniref:probable G-protein coupled receptor Mth-like 1 n=1 Tax=Uloborus diversus TaxID=327109 RepID=UPI00240A4382|nr:probable G-protein coupled receptor Mth-like 1 [Uloborus diversus]